ncbi:MAG TPA: dihydropteroate synthase [candidate division Zixibacteria bacterium]|nr:dihydropteroate synthase [candidate division Zixibacteria bacterium]
MGVVNVTPDSFSDGGRFHRPERAIDCAIRLAIEGADIIDIGGESSRPGAQPVPLEVELERAIPVIASLADKVASKISIDTYKSDVAREALSAGATMVNDITAMTADPKMPEVVADTGAEVVLMHMLGTPQTMQKEPHYDDVVGEVCDFLSKRAEEAVKMGIPEDKIYIDPGIGFGKTLEHNLQLLANIRKIKALGFPVVVGTSRKSFIEGILGKRPPAERLVGSLASFIWCVLEGADVLRVHDIRPTYEALAVVEAIAEHGGRS